MHEFRYAIRRLCGSPTFTIAATLTLAIAIGATASVFSVVNAVLPRSAGLRDAQHVLWVWANNPARHLTEIPTSAANYLDWRAQNTSFSDLAAATLQPVTMTGAQEPERVRRLAVTPNWFRVLGLVPAVGRALAADSAGPPEVLISYGYWQRHFGGARSVIGRSVMLDEQPYTVVGVMPAGTFGVSDEVWTRLSFSSQDVKQRAAHEVFVYARLKQGVTLDAARHEMQTIALRLAAVYPDADRGWTVDTRPVLDALEQPVKPALLMALVAAACVLLIGVANLANLFMVRYLAREREMAVRTALGATRARLLRELLVEASLLGFTAGAVGVGVAFVGARALRFMAPQWLPRLDEVGVDGRVIAFCAGASVAAVLVFGVLPAWQTARGNLASFLKAGSRSTGSSQQWRLQNAFVVAQISIALVLLTSAGLLIESFAHFRRIDLGFRPDGVLSAAVTSSVRRYTTPEQQAAFITNVIDGIARQPGVEAASASSDFPGTATAQVTFAIAGEPLLDPTNRPNAYVQAITSDYFHTMDVPLLQGRAFRASDDGRAPRVVVVDQRLVHRFFADGDAIGRRLVLAPGPTGAADTAAIVGVAASVRQGGLTALEAPEIYTPLAQFPDNTVALEVRTSGDPNMQQTMLRRAVANVDPTVPVYWVATMTERVGEEVATTRFATLLTSLFAVIAMVLGAVGVYAVLAYVVAQGRRDIAVRFALGADGAHVVGTVLRRALRLALAGIALGSVAAWGATRALASLLEGVGPHDPRIFGGAAVTFVAVALVAASIPAVRTTRLNPVIALTSE